MPQRVRELTFQLATRFVSGQLEDYSIAGIEAEAKALKRWEQRVAAIDPDSLSLFVRGDRDLVLNNSAVCC